VFFGRQFFQILRKQSDFARGGGALQHFAYGRDCLGPPDLREGIKHGPAR
jgi:hypothetical protein